MMLILRAAALLLGSALVAATLASAVKTFVLPRSAQDLLTRIAFLAVRRLFDLRLRGRDYASRDRVLAFYAPVGLLSLLVIWLLLVWVGYSGMFWAAGMPSWVEAARDSGSSLLPLGF